MRLRQVLPRLGWVVLIGVSMLAARAAWRAPTGYPAAPPPAPLPRATEAERTHLRAQAQTLAATLAELRRSSPTPPAPELVADQLTLPDNPLVPGRGGLVVSCPPEVAEAVADWAWCPETDRVAPLGL